MADHAAHGCNSALEMMEARAPRCKKSGKREGKPHLDIGIGLNSGVASVGNMGSAVALRLHGAGRHGESCRRGLKGSTKITARILL